MSLRVHVAMGDPQAPFDTVMAVLRHHGLLSATGRLRDGVQLVSMGDHFDWGPRHQRRQATGEGLALLQWLSSHPAEQVVLIAGNHDLGRVGELAGFEDDAAFEAAWAEAVQAYDGGDDRARLEAALLARYPAVPDSECLARDFSCFSVAQRDLVTTLLRQGRLRLAHAHRDLLLVHAGVTRADLAALGRPEPTTASGAAAALNGLLDERVAAWRGGALDLSPLHLAGTARDGLGGGILFHRPAHPGHDGGQTPGRRRRFDPRDLPSGFPQAIGHVRDGKARLLLGPWADGAAAADGPVRSLRVAGEAVRYAHGAAPDARLYFLDGGMSALPPGELHRYELFDLDARRPFSPARSG